MNEKKLRYSDPFLRGKLKSYEYKKNQKYFLHKQIPLDFIRALYTLGIAGLRVGLVLIYFSILKKTETVRLSRDLLKQFSISRSQKFRGLKELKDVGLVEFEAKRGNSSEITVLINNCKRDCS